MVKNFHYKKNNHPSNRTDLQFPPHVLVLATISSVGIIRGAIESEQYRHFYSVVTTLSQLQSNLVTNCLNLRNCLLARYFLDVSPEGKAQW